MLRLSLRSGLRAIGLLLPLAVLGGIEPAAAQTPAPRDGVLLRIRPRVGDTIRVRFDQEVEMIGTVPGSDSSQVTTRLLVLARTIVQRAEPTGTIVLSITDSVSVTSTDGSSGAGMEQARQNMQGVRVAMRVNGDGSATVLSDVRQLGPELRSLVEQMPATLPNHRVRVGESWNQVLEMPHAGDTSRAAGAGALNATFRLDSLSRGGRYAYISMRGVISQSPGADALPSGVRFDMSGTMTGRMIVDRVRGWMLSSRTALFVRSVLTPPRRSDAAPMQFRMRITQSTKTVD